MASPYSPVFSALGIGSSDIVRHYAKSEPMQPPFDGSQIERVFHGLETKALDDLRRSGARDGYALNRSISMRFRYQVHEIRVPVTRALSSAREIDLLLKEFVELYEQTFGRETALKEAGIEMLTFHVASRVKAVQAMLRKFPRSGPDSKNALTSHRKVYWEDSFLETPVFDQRSLAPGNQIAGPAVVEAPNTTILIHPGQRASIDEYLNIAIEL
jgi:N-methylhydantoinase A